MAARAPLQGPPFPVERLAMMLPHLRGLASDSRRVLPGMGFAAYPDEAGDGRDWIADALARGAGGLLWEPLGHRGPSSWPVPHLAIEGLRDHASRIGAIVHGDPSAHLQVIGVTGTNGKTSSTHWIAQALHAAGRPCGLVGTLGTGMPGAVKATGYTTPGPLELQQQLAELRREGARSVAMEVSSHGLALGRVDGVHFDLAVFTNLTRDHLDFHGSMEVYGAAKAALFHAAGLRRAVINVDDAFGARLHADLRRADIATLACTQAPGLDPGGPVLRAREVRLSPEGMTFRLDTSQGTVEITTELVGRFNLANLLGVIGCLLESGVALADLPPRVAALEPPPGRLQRIGRPGGVQVVIDYAHSPDALEQVLLALRASLDGGQLICVFGCGGDRDPGKRPQMGAIAERLADAVVLTSDNPRSEDPEAILADIAAGMARSPRLRTADRAAAIAAAIRLGRPGDIVLVAGKGHETTQEVAGVKMPFSDQAHARRGLGLAEGEP
jgi:UDP-N-acetylmuramoyl-L-alanyl-D-glutamate--2,6-diaminopimelate ligase